MLHGIKKQEYNFKFNIMAGCFGNSFWDRNMESQLFRHLEEGDTYLCPKCGMTIHIDVDDWAFDDETNTLTCKCGHSEAF